ncbi:MAG: hypothetical protein K8F52_15680 [Candidatus Scalindua rubra]|nr:hypothetical protein [Candidatus Scalindua rubra]
MFLNTLNSYGCFSIDVNLSGRFFKGSTAGFKNLAEKFPVDEYQESIEKKDDSEITLKKDIRRERIKTLLEAFPYLSGGARLSTVYSDLAPKFVIYCATDSGNHLFQEIGSIYDHLNLKSLLESVNDFKDNIKSDIYIALKNGFLDGKRQGIIDALNKYNGENDNGFRFIFKDDLSGINETTKAFTENVVTALFNTENI